MRSLRTLNTLARSCASALAACALLAVPAVAATAFDLSPEQAARITTGKDAAAAATLPKDYKWVKEGVLTVGINPFGLPISSYASDSKTIIGADPELALLVAQTLGLKLELVPTQWADWPLALASGKVDAVISNVGVTELRKEKFDFSSYRLGLHGFYVRNDSAVKSIKEPKDVAGLRIITGSGTNQEKILLEWNKRNVAAGLKPLELQFYDDPQVQSLALVSGRADANFNPNGPQAYVAARDGKTRLVGTVNAGWPLRSDVGIATRKDSGLAPALTQALNGLVQNGKYAQALTRWSLAEEALPKAETNPPGLPKF
ncbi:polar amino acid transport system substrate-binding protein [Rhodoferax sp. OV413]|uniref:ABC transporter substrate-binding protein n=1 Tax=Rhodoferax sp. OV413 TaxID=1855285 RepID=UPI00088C4600|nr:ABC transporter substrate-binding protein [Rhodoferax sp. OV413]SDO83894.1 polar amino acid transport system substrate-binding protein [Rhodoferax sp. OV413]